MGYPVTPGAVEINVPSSDALAARFDARVIDSEGKPPNCIIRSTDLYTVRFDVWLIGDLWNCMCGTFCFDLEYTIAGQPGENTDLGLILGREAEVEFKGCERRHYTWHRQIAADAIYIDEKKGSTYELKARVVTRDPCGDPGPLVGKKALGDFVFFVPKAGSVEPVGAVNGADTDTELVTAG